MSFLCYHLSLYATINKKKQESLRPKFDSCPQNNDIMITFNSDKINTLNQNSYNNLINTIDFKSVTCSCGHTGTLTRHSYYTRNVKVYGGFKVRISILRVKCSSCGKTHAILPSCIVPYSQILLNDHIRIIINYEENLPANDVMNDNPLIDESNVSYIIRNYKKYWKQRLISCSILLNEHTSDFISKCFMYFSRQFMQIKCTTNILNTSTHIT